MSNKTQLQTNNTALDGYIARINAAKEVAASLPDAGGGSSGGTLETYTLYCLSGAATEGRYVVYSTLDSSGNIISGVMENFNLQTPIVCVCGAPVTLYRNDTYGDDFTLMSGLTLLRSDSSKGIYIFDGDAEAGTECYIRFNLE